MRAAAVVALAFVLTASNGAAAAQAPGPPPRTFRTVAPLVARDSAPNALESGIEGTVTLGPVCPGPQRPDCPPDRPYRATIVINGPSGEVARVTSGEDGRYRVLLAPGSYTLLPQTEPGRLLPHARPIDVVVPPGAVVTVDVPYDTGIR